MVALFKEILVACIEPLLLPTLLLVADAHESLILRKLILKRSLPDVRQCVSCAHSASIRACCCGTVSVELSLRICVRALQTRSLDVAKILIQITIVFRINNSVPVATEPASTVCR